MSEEDRKKVREENTRIIELAMRESNDPAERDIAWTLKYVQDAYPKVGVKCCIGGLALWCCGEPIQEGLPRKIREYADSHRTGDMLTDWVNAQKEIAQHMPIAYSVNYKKPF